MATLLSISTEITPVLPCNFDLIGEHKTLLRLQGGLVESSSSTSFPILVFAPLPCRSTLQSKHGIANRSNGKKRETIEAIVGSCISRAVAFSGHQFRAVLKSFQDLSARKSNTFGDVRCNNAGQNHPSGPTDNGNGGGGGGGGGSESGSDGEGKSGGGGSSNTPLMGGAVWRRAQKGSITRGRTVLLRAANRRPIYDHATSGGDGGSRLLLWAAEGLVARALMEPAVVETMFQAMLMPFHAIFIILLLPALGYQISQFVMVSFVVGPLVAILLLFLVWRLLWVYKAQGIERDGDGYGDEQEDGEME